ncbi:MAG: polysaccharide pyruvyl transferase family protein [Pirellulaceae bacterium]
MHRRSFLRRTSAAVAMASAGIGSSSARAAHANGPNILLRSSWQTVNIGDIAHTPGVLRLLEKHLPDANVFLWPSKIDNGVDALLAARFPKVRVVQTKSQIADAFKTCDFLLHGSGPSLVAQRSIIQWSEETGKPYGVYGITVSPRQSSSAVDTSGEALQRTIDVLSGAEFVFFRDSKSMAFAKSQGCQSPIMEFGPDGAFACDLRDEDKAKAFLHRHDLQNQGFMCCIPRLRYTPYWTIPEKKAAFDPVRHARNEAMKASDHAPLLESINRIVRETNLKVLLCPEDQTQMRVAKENLLDRLPADVLPRVVWRPNYWLTGEAISTYVRSAGLFGHEMHSPIMCVGNGVPAIVCRWAEQTSKGFMWQDIGLGDWLFDLDDPDQSAKVSDAVLWVAKHPDAAKEKVADARRFVEDRQAKTMAILKQHVS